MNFIQRPEEHFCLLHPYFRQAEQLQGNFCIISYQREKLYPFSSLPVVNPILGSLYLLVHCTWHKNIHLRHQPPMLQPCSTLSTLWILLEYPNRFDYFGQSYMNIHRKFVQEMKLGKEKLHARMVKPLVTLLQLIYAALVRPQQFVKSCNLFINTKGNFPPLV